MTEHEAYVAFNMVPDIGSVKLAALVKKHGTAAAAWEAFRGKTDWKGEPVDWESEIARAGRKHVTIISCADPRYPAGLNDLPSKPLALYVAGDPAALSVPCVAVVGTRLPTLYGGDMAERFSAGLARMPMCIVSGLAVGIDTHAHMGALAAGGTTVGVLGGALDMFFPEENRRLGRKIVAAGGAVVSEYPFGFPPGKKTFPQRNRIVAALSLGVLAVECPAQSGTLITCGFARELGRKVMAVPANLDSKNSAGCWNLIRNGATMVTSAEEAAAAMGITAGDGTEPHVASQASDGRSARRTASPRKQDNARLTLDEAAVLKAVPSTGITLERLAFSTRLPATVIAKAAMSLRLKRLVRFMPGNRIAPEKASH